jgi:hypothetical protein
MLCTADLQDLAYEDDAEEGIIREMMEDPVFNLTWVEKATRLCVIVGVLLLLILLLR